MILGHLVSLAALCVFGGPMCLWGPPCFFGGPCNSTFCIQTETALRRHHPGNISVCHPSHDQLAQGLHFFFDSNISSNVLWTFCLMHSFVNVLSFFTNQQNFYLHKITSLPIITSPLTRDTAQPQQNSTPFPFKRARPGSGHRSRSSGWESHQGVLMSASHSTLCFNGGKLL